MMSSVALFLATVLAASAPAFDVVDDLFSDLKKAVKAEKDEDAVSIVDDLIQEAKGSDPKLIKKIVKGLSGFFSVRRDRDKNALYIGIAAAMSEFGGEGEKAIVKALKKKELRKRPEVIAVLLEALGSFENPKNVKIITASLRDPNGLIVKSAAAALHNYRRAPGEVRKGAAEDLVKCYVRAARAVEKDPENERLELHLDQIELSLIQALSELTGETFRRASDWDEWFKENKDEDWTGSDGEDDDGEGSRA